MLFRSIENHLPIEILPIKITFQGINSNNNLFSSNLFSFENSSYLNLIVANNREESSKNIELHKNHKNMKITNLFFESIYIQGIDNPKNYIFFRIEDDLFYVKKDSKLISEELIKIIDSQKHLQEIYEGEILCSCYNKSKSKHTSNANISSKIKLEEDDSDAFSNRDLPILFPLRKVNSEEFIKMLYIDLIKSKSFLVFNDNISSVKSEAESFHKFLNNQKKEIERIVMLRDKNNIKNFILAIFNNKEFRDRFQDNLSNNFNKYLYHIN